MDLIGYGVALWLVYLVWGYLRVVALVSGKNRGARATLLEEEIAYAAYHYYRVNVLLRLVVDLAADVISPSMLRGPAPTKVLRRAALMIAVLDAFVESSLKLDATTVVNIQRHWNERLESRLATYALLGRTHHLLARLLVACATNRDRHLFVSTSAHRIRRR